MITSEENDQLIQVSDFWFDHLKPQDWFVQSDQVDQEIINKFSDQYFYFKDRDLDNMDLSGEQILAAIILFDSPSGKNLGIDDNALSPGRHP